MRLLFYNFFSLFFLLSTYNIQARIEVEYKIPLAPWASFKLSGLAGEISKLSKRGLFDFPKAIGTKEPFQVSPLQKLFFVDEYYDTKSEILNQSNLVLRYRRRFKNSWQYRLHQWFPHVRLFFPYRTEIQLKKLISIHKNKYHFEEKRIESRDDDKLKDPPTKPKEWISPSLDLFSQFSIEITEILVKKLTIETDRKRFHLKLKNPWGSGPNPEQVFLFSLDSSRAESACEEKVNFTQLEIEAERNTSVELRNQASIIPSSPSQSIMKEKSQKALEAYKRDHQSLYQLSLKWMKSFIGNEKHLQKYLLARKSLKCDHN